jgi:hypothetical protein
MGRRAEAKDVFYTFARNRGIADLDHVVQQLPSLMELNINVEDLRRSVSEAG